MNLGDITPLILTFNEKENIQRTLQPLNWAKEIVIIDSGSTDGTPDLARAAHSNVRVVARQFDDHTSQWNFGLDQIRTPWVLSLDADYLLSLEFQKELERLRDGDDVTGYSAEFRYCISGLPLRTSAYPPRTVLFRRDRSRYRDDGHTQKLFTDGRVLPLQTKIDHDDRKPFNRWFREQLRYSKIEARHLIKIRKEKGERRNELSFQDGLRLMIFIAPPAMFLYLLFGRGLILDGWRGSYYVAQRTIAELLLSARLIVEMLRR